MSIFIIIISNYNSKNGQTATNCLDLHQYVLNIISGHDRIVAMKHKTTPAAYGPDKY